MRQKPTRRGNWQPFRSLRARLVLILAVTLLPAGVLACVQALSNFQRLSALAEDSVLQAAVLSAREEESFIVGARRLLKTLSVLPDVIDLQSQRCGEILRSVLMISELYRSLVLTNRSGDVVCSSAPLTRPLNIANERWYREVVARQDFTVTGRTRGLMSEADVTAIGLPIFDRQGTLNAALFLTLEARWLQDLLVQPSTPVVAHVAMIDGNGNVIAAASSSAKDRSWLPPPARLRESLAAEPQALRLTGSDGGHRIYALAPLLRDEIYLVLGSVDGLAVTAWNWRFLSAVGAPILMWLIALVVAWVAIDRLVLRPTLALQRVAAAFAAGRHNVRVPDDDDSPEEIRELGRTVNMMADNLVTREGELEQAVDDQRGLLKELHHRVKNNLQVIASLLNLQVRNATHERERRALNATQDRVYALAKIHEQLYRGHKIQWVPLDQLLPDIAGHLQQSRPQLRAALSVHYDIDSLEANTRRVVPIALLVTEAVSSALDQEVADDGPRNLWISLKRSGETGATLTVRNDSRPGAPGSRRNGLSFSLMKGFVRQLGGRSHLHTDEGYRLTVHIPDLY